MLTDKQKSCSIIFKFQSFIVASTVNQTLFLWSVHNAILFSNQMQLNFKLDTYRVVSLIPLLRNISVNADQPECSPWKTVLECIFLAGILLWEFPKGLFLHTQIEELFKQHHFYDPSELLCVCSWKRLTQKSVIDFESSPLWFSL